MVGTVRFEARIQELVENLPDMAALVEPLLIVRRALREQIVILHRRLLAIVRNDEVCRRLMTTPGVGPVVALTYRATVDVPARFRKSKAVTPFQNSSWECRLAAVHESVHGTKPTLPAWSAMSVVRVRPEVAFRGRNHCFDSARFVLKSGSTRLDGIRAWLPLATEASSPRPVFASSSGCEDWSSSSCRRRWPHFRPPS
jgi:hypothetical protein